jgi:hypothetical protein
MECGSTVQVAVVSSRGKHLVCRIRALFGSRH